MIDTLFTGLVLIVSIALGILAQRLGSSRHISKAKKNADALRDRAQKDTAIVIREYGARTREEVQSIESTALEEQKTFQSESEQIELRVRKLETRSTERAKDLAQQKTELEQLRARAESAQQNIQGIEVQIEGIRVRQFTALEERAGQTSAAICTQLIEGLIAEETALGADRLRRLDAERPEEFRRQAWRLMDIITQRYTGHFPRERGGATITLEPDEFQRLVEQNPGHLDILREQAGIELRVNPEEFSIRVESSDGVLREFCRRAITRFATEQIRSPERLAKAIHADLQREILANGREAFKVLGLRVSAEPIVELVGRLNWRASYTQNQYKHSIEASFFAGLIAAELGLDVDLAKRATLLHDIGKSMTTASEGSHALLGANLARECGEPEIAANAVAAHHGEEPPQSPYVWLVIAADAMSGGRPGARRETTESYSDRVGELERAALSFSGVDSVHAAQAGRELRVYVDEFKVGDQDLQRLCNLIATKIADDVVFPGQVRVTVVRQFRAVEFAG